MLNRSMSKTLYNIQQIYNASFIMFSRHKNIFKIFFHISKAFLQLLLICHKLVLKNGHTNLYTILIGISFCFLSVGLYVYN